MKLDEIQNKAKAKLKSLNRKKADPRFQKVMGKLIFEKLLDHPHISPHTGAIELEDALWAGKYEPRIFAMIPAILLKKPKVFRIAKEIPKDLHEILLKIKKGEPCPEFRGVPAKEYQYWIPRIGHKGKYPSHLKTYRFHQKDLEKINYLKEKLKGNEVDIIRLALENLIHKVA